MRTALISIGGFGGKDDALETARERVGEARAAGAELICLPHLSFSPYFPARRDRGALDFAERLPSAAYRSVLEAAGPAWVFASSYESEGEGVFYVTARLGRSGGTAVSYRQVRVEAAPGRFEQMFWSPGHAGYAVAGLPPGPAGLVVGPDARAPEAYAELARFGARLVVGGVSEDEAGWTRTRRVAVGMAAAHGFGVVLVNRHGSEGDAAFPGGALAVDASGAELTAGPEGLYDLDWGPA
jgi:predicted amidohydrolase